MVYSIFSVVIMTTVTLPNAGQTTLVQQSGGG
ncbi:hypothetical protein SMU89_05302 [Streptococcus mutans NLML1]|nr:hypothetical protein SMU77_00940 [Streptococcus mutans NV1996]EMC32812.1 hypothetical protein SMU89_05302 [Streptococcus mutans NLML1]